MNSLNTNRKVTEKPFSVSSSVRMKEAADKYLRAMSDEKSRDQLIEDYLPLVKSIVSRMRFHFPDHYEIEDMYGIAVKALIVSVNQFNPSKGKSFGNYAALRIKGSLLDELRKIDSLPRANRAKARSLQATIAEMESRVKRPVSVDEVKEELNLSHSEYETLLKETQPITFVPIDAPVSANSGDGDSTPLSETISDPTEQDASEKTEYREKVLLLRDKIKNLPDPQKKILMLYYYEELKLSEIAHIFGLSEGRISQILSQSVLTLRSHFQTLL
ncbi:MAG: FliA/WhiG family RNA polymerase sigma factor [Opitutae bacterium]|jgi:RNA polymerase sigma factor FliA|nr:FliA/WhiG family RNA polymerase sigma factor [Opitutae bacterium]MBT5717149.1 FliA/WhiG family RNA polymerase sigma factor [Opitutae bacterium]